MKKTKIKEETFFYKNLEVNILIPSKPNDNYDWVFKCDYYNEFKELDYALVSKGYHIVYIKNISRWAYMKDIINKGELAFYLNSTYNLSINFSLIGYGSAGSIAIKFASLYPEFINTIILDSPVVDFISCPGSIKDNYSKNSWLKEFSIIYPNENLISLETSKVNPKNLLNVLNEYDIPIYIMYSNNDEVVPFNDNGKLILDAYDNKDSIILSLKDSDGHSQFGDINKIDDIVSFIENNSY